jgi:hypothetical protein
MWEPRRLTNLWASIVCYRNSFILRYDSTVRRPSTWYWIYWTHTHNSELQAITASPLIFTIHKSTQHSLSLFQPVMSSAAVFWHRLLTMEVLPLHVLKSCLHRLPYRTHLAAPVGFKITLRYGTYRNTMFLTIPLLLCVDSLFRERVKEPLTGKRPWYISAHLAVVA